MSVGDPRNYEIGPERIAAVGKLKAAGEKAFLRFLGQSGVKLCEAVFMPPGVRHDIAGLLASMLAAGRPPQNHQRIERQVGEKWQKVPPYKKRNYGPPVPGWIVTIDHRTSFPAPRPKGVSPQPSDPKPVIITPRGIVLAGIAGNQQPSKFGISNTPTDYIGPANDAKKQVTLAGIPWITPEERIYRCPDTELDATERAQHDYGLGRIAPPTLIRPHPVV